MARRLMFVSRVRHFNRRPRNWSIIVHVRGNNHLHLYHNMCLVALSYTFLVSLFNQQTN